jgi:hypothetical protein
MTLFWHLADGVEYMLTGIGRSSSRAKNLQE